MAFYSVFYSFFVTDTAKEGTLFVKIFVVFHSSVFALFICLGDFYAYNGLLVVYFFVGFIINALSLEVAGRYNVTIRNIKDNNSEIRDLLIKYKDK